MVAGDGLTFNALRRANVARLPVFKNKYGEPAHSEPDGSDWSDAEWLEAVVGELGEYANIRKKFRRGDLSWSEFQKQAASELADIVTYLDILAFRLDINLGMAVKDKWNEVSKRVGVSLRLHATGQFHFEDNADPVQQGDAMDYYEREGNGL